MREGSRPQCPKVKRSQALEYKAMGRTVPVFAGRRQCPRPCKARLSKQSNFKSHWVHMYGRVITYVWSVRAALRLPLLAVLEPILGSIASDLRPPKVLGLPPPQGPRLCLWDPQGRFGPVKPQRTHDKGWNSNSNSFLAVANDRRRAGARAWPRRESQESH